MAFSLRTWHHPVSSPWPVPVPAPPVPSAVGACTILHCQLVKVKVTSLSCVLLFSTPWTAAYQDPLSMGFSRQEYWCGLPLPSPGDLPDPGIEPGSLTLQADTLPSESPGKPFFQLIFSLALFSAYFQFSCPFLPKNGAPFPHSPFWVNLKVFKFLSVSYVAEQISHWTATWFNSRT